MGTCQRCRTYVRQQDSAMQRDATAKIFHNRARSMSASAAASFHLLSTHSITCPLSIHTRICSPLPPFLSLIFHCSPLYISHTELNVAPTSSDLFQQTKLDSFFIATDVCRNSASSSSASLQGSQIQLWLPPRRQQRRLACSPERNQRFSSRPTWNPEWGLLRTRLWVSLACSFNFRQRLSHLKWCD